MIPCLFYVYQTISIKWNVWNDMTQVNSILDLAITNSHIWDEYCECWQVFVLLETVLIIGLLFTIGLPMLNFVRNSLPWFGDNMFKQCLYQIFFSNIKNPLVTKKGLLLNWWIKYLSMKALGYIYVCTGLQELGGRCLSKSISGPSNFTRMQPIGPVQTMICVCLDRRLTVIAYMETILCCTNNWFINIRAIKVCGNLADGW